MPRLVFELDDEELALLEALRVAGGFRSNEATLRELIRTTGGFLPDGQGPVQEGDIKGSRKSGGRKALAVAAVGRIIGYDAIDGSPIVSSGGSRFKGGR